MMFDRATIGLLSATLIGLSPSLRADGDELRSIERAVAHSARQQQLIQTRLEQIGAQQHSLRQRAQQLTGRRGDLARSELARLQQQSRSLQAQLLRQQRALQIARQDLLSQQRRLLRAYQRLGGDTADASLRQRMGELRRELGLDARGQDSVGAQLQRYDHAEKMLRRKARVLAQRIRQLRQEQAVAGGVADTMRDQSLFDEQERRLQLSRAITRRSVKAGGEQSAADQNDDSAARSQDPNTEVGGAECSGGDCGSPGSGGNAPPSDPGYDGEAGGFAGTPESSGGGDLGADLGGGPALQTRAQSTELSGLISGERVSDLIDSDLDTLLGGSEHFGSSAAEMRELNRLRQELLRNADQLARQRRAVESQARRRTMAK